MQPHASAADLDMRTINEGPMFLLTYLRSIAALAAFLSGGAAIAQQNFAIAPQPRQSIHLAVHVTPKKGSTETTGLQRNDFSVLDNNAAQTILSFEEVVANQDPARVILVVDAVNTDFTRVAYLREQAQTFLKANGGQLENPTTLAVLTDRGTQIQPDFTKNGIELSGSLDHYTTGLRDITRASGFWGADERVDISLRAVRELMAYASKFPGRKVLLWISPGWPLLSGPRVDLSAKQQQQIFTNVVAFSNELQQANITLYSVNPLGVEQSLFREDYYQNFIKGVATPRQTDLADLSLQVLAVQSGGLALNGSNDVAGGLKACFADLHSWYEISVPAGHAERPNEYHQIQVQTDKPGLVARTRDGYYAQP